MTLTLPVFNQMVSEISIISKLKNGDNTGGGEDDYYGEEAGEKLSQFLKGRNK